MPNRKYTGNTDGAAKGRRAGLTVFINEIVRLSDKGLWNNGDWGVRNMKGKQSLSVHATGRAVDLSYRFMPNTKDASNTKGKQAGRAVALQWCKILTQHADALGLEMIIDYFPEPYGRAWQCSRNGWVKYERKMVEGAPKGDWLHCEISPAMADDPAAMKAAFAVIEQQMMSNPNG
jgi:hypothetical protein